jgi:hypothetical protein
MFGVRQRGHDQIRIAQRLVELHGLFELVAQQRLQGDMRAATLQAVVVEQFPQLSGGTLLVPGELQNYTGRR